MACAAALLDAQARVTVMDVGADLAPETARRASDLARQASWSNADRAWIQQGLAGDKAGIPLKTLFGEDFMYATSAVAGDRLPDNFGQWPSRAVGGLSRVWGATLKRLGTQELREWPLAAQALTPHYAAVEELLGSGGPPMSVQASALLARWREQDAAMTALGARAVPSSLAVSPDCRVCGMCLYGCPYGCIFSADMLVRRFREREGFVYRGGLQARRIAAMPRGVRVTATQADETELTIEADRVFVAAGVLGTARLMLRSFCEREEALTLRDGQYFLLPFLSPDPALETSHSLSQIFVELEGAEPVHVQFYTRNDVYARVLAAPFGRFAASVRPLADRLGRRIVLAQGYLPSALSGGAKLRLDGDGRLDIRPMANARTRPALRDAWRRLAKIGRLAGLRSVPFLAQQAEIGRGYHSGATLPMSQAPSRLQSDALGRAGAADRVHVVDASVWPSIPSGPVTLTAMANAHRIATGVARLDSA